MLNTPFSPWPSFTQEEADAVSRVLLSNRVNYWTGDECRAFEIEFAQFVATQYAIAVANGTVALELALRALGIGAGDEVIVPPRTFIATASAVVHVGALPNFADIDRDSQNLSVDTIAPAINERTKAIICVHLAGQPCDMDPIMQLAAQHGLKVIEDCAQAHGASYKGQSVGSIGDIGCWSFCQDKIMSTGGEGGMITTNDRSLWSSIWSLKDHGKSYEAVFEKQHPPGFRWLHEHIGSNCRMTEMQAAIGRIQLGRLKMWNQKRNANAERIHMAAETCEILRVPSIRCQHAGCGPDSSCLHACYKCYVFVRPERLANGWDRDRIMNEINAAGVPCYSGTCSEVYLERAFDDIDCRPPNGLPVAWELGETSLMFLVHPTLSEAEIDLACKVICDTCEAAAKH